ncbi:MAG: RuBisCO large subunit C-terminal-like domain-containing protein [Kouleothrix sp.]
MEREYLNKYGRPLLGATTKPKLGLRRATMGRGATKPAWWSRLRERRREDQLAAVYALARPLVLQAEAVNKAQAATGEIKGHYLNVTAGTMEEMYGCRTRQALGRATIMIDLTTATPPSRACPSGAARMASFSTCTARATAPTPARKPMA